MKIAVVHKLAAVNHRSRRDIQSRTEHKNLPALARVAEVCIFS